MYKVFTKGVQLGLIYMKEMIRYLLIAISNKVGEEHL